MLYYTEVLPYAPRCMCNMPSSLVPPENWFGINTGDGFHRSSKSNYINATFERRKKALQM